ncbi:La protein homolog [Eumeta japonica]|uniref:La protein homolog n=1 Tax=Eumeta variegata TaxID=151549 RepID=A0A4C1V0B1_EUMVA|nr:La protein homolog [Eumeta japonica]
MTDTETVPKDENNESEKNNETSEKNGKLPNQTEPETQLDEISDLDKEIIRQIEYYFDICWSAPRAWARRATSRAAGVETRAPVGTARYRTLVRFQHDTRTRLKAHRTRRCTLRPSGTRGPEPKATDRDDERDVNLPRDKFLREQVKLDDGWVPFDVLTTFNRLARLSKDTDVIAAALSKSTTGLLEISEDNKKVRRSPEIPLPEMNEDRRKELTSRTVYAKGFPRDSTLDDLLLYFKEHGEIENVIMRRYLDKNTKKRLFKGSVFATFKNKEQAQKFMDAKSIKYQDTELLIHWQEDYLQLKQEEYAARKEQRGKKHKVQEVKEEEKEQIKFPQGTVLHFTEADPKMTRENIKEALTKLGGEVAYIDYKVGDKEGWVRLAKENTAKEMMEKSTDGKFKVGEGEIIMKPLEDEEEKTYLERIVEEMTKRRKNTNKHKHQKGGFKGGKHQGGRKRKQGVHSDAPSGKVKI